MSDEKKLCSNCKKDIIVVNYDVHFAHCCRNIEICQKCSEPVSRKEVERHLKQAHAVVSCERCEQSIERWKLSEHQDTCSKRPISCLYCKLDVPWDGIKDHESYCGSRTKLCQNCKKYVMFKEEEKHVKDCLDLMMVDEVRKAVGNRTCSQLLKCGYDNKRTQLQREKNVSLDSPVSGTSKLHSENVDNRQVSETTESSSGMNSLQYLRKYAFGDSETESDDDAVASVSASFSKLSTCENQPSNNNSFLLKKKNNEVPQSDTSCLSPHKEMPADLQSGVSYDSNVPPRSSCNDIVQTPSLAPVTQRNPHITGDSARSSAKPFTDAEIRSKALLQLPSLCPLCKKEFPVSQLESHVFQCDCQTLPCTICGLEVKLRNRDNHVNKCKLKCEPSGTKNTKRTKRKNVEVVNYPSGKSISANYSAAYPAMLPCEFCDKSFPDYFLIEHQSGCKPELFSPAKVSEIHPEPNMKPTYSTVVSAKSTVVKNACPDDELKDKKTLVSRSDLDKSFAVNAHKQNKRGRSGSGHYASGREATPGEFLPSMAYAGFPDCYKLYEQQGPYVFHFGKLAFPQYSNPADIHSVQLHPGAAKHSYTKSDVHTERNYNEGKTSHGRKVTSTDRKKKMPMREENSDSDSIYESCDSNSESDSRKQGTQSKGISSKQEKYSPKKGKSSQHATSHKEFSKKKQKKSKKSSKKK